MSERAKFASHQLPMSENSIPVGDMIVFATTSATDDHLSGGILMRQPRRSSLFRDPALAGRIERVEAEIVAASRSRQAPA